MSEKIIEEVMPESKKGRLTAYKGITPTRAVRRRCLDCSGYSDKAVRECEIDNCILHPLRMGKGRTKLKIIRQFCMDCAGTNDNVLNCVDKDCSLYPFRLGKNPNYSEEIREARRQRCVFSKTARLARKYV